MLQTKSSVRASLSAVRDPYPKPGESGIVDCSVKDKPCCSSRTFDNVSDSVRSFPIQTTIWSETVRASARKLPKKEQTTTL
jgi:hypothetical protein